MVVMPVNFSFLSDVPAMVNDTSADDYPAWDFAPARRKCRIGRPSNERSRRMPLGADYPFLDVFWTMVIFFAWVIFVWLLIMVLADNFRRRDHSGWAKAGWTLFVIFLPLFGVLIYMIARPATADAM
jgi:Phospholipase_D-nuclease N-terminal